MAVIDVREIGPGRELTADALAQTRFLTRSYWVYTDSDTTDATAVEQAYSLPLYFESHPLLPAALMIRRSARQTDEDDRKWLVTCEYTTDYGASSQLGEDLLKRKPTVSRETIVVQIPFLRSVQGVGNDTEPRPVLTSAKGTYENTPMVERARLRLTVQVNASSAGDDVAGDYLYCINSTQWESYKALCVLLSGFRSQGPTVDPNTGGEIWQQTYTLDVITRPTDEDEEYSVGADRSPWDLRLLNVDTHEFVTLLPGQSGTAGRRPIFINGRPATAPLNLAGRQLTAAEIEDGAFTFGRFRRYPRKDLNKLVTLEGGLPLLDFVEPGLPQVAGNNAGQ